MALHWPMVALAACSLIIARSLLLALWSSRDHCCLLLDHRAIIVACSLIIARSLLLDCIGISLANGCSLIDAWLHWHFVGQWLLLDWFLIALAFRWPMVAFRWQTFYNDNNNEIDDNIVPTSYDHLSMIITMIVPTSYNHLSMIIIKNFRTFISRIPPHIGTCNQSEVRLCPNLRQMPLYIQDRKIFKIFLSRIQPHLWRPSEGEDTLRPKLMLMAMFIQVWKILKNFLYHLSSTFWNRIIP